MEQLEQLEQPEVEAKRSTPTIKSIKARFRIQPSRWLVRPRRWIRMAFEQGPEQILPIGLVFGILVSMGSLASSAAMLYLHFPVHTVFCQEQKLADGHPKSQAACYPNFFVSTWLLIFAASAISGLFYTFLGVQQEQLRLRQGVAMGGSLLTMVLWMSTVVFGFLPAQVSVAPNSNSNSASPMPYVHAYGMLSSTVENYMYAHNKSQMPSGSAATHGNSGQLV